jgi:glyceraldehyde 3-phosphate dehydrogenase
MQGGRHFQYDMGGNEMTIRIGINGFGRIGRQVLRAISERHPETLSVIAINDLTDAKTNAHLLKYDSTYGRYPKPIEATENSLIIYGNEIKVLAERDPAKLPWKELGIDIVIESTGLFTDATKAISHINAGAKKVIISAPAKGEDFTIVLGVNDHKYDPKSHNVISNASCTTNSVAPMIKVLNDAFTVKRGLMTTVHSYTNDQRILDQFHSDLRRARSAATNVIPTTTGAAQACGIVIPELQGKIHGMSLRVPLNTVSVTDLVVDLDQQVTPEDVNTAFLNASRGPLKGILAYTDEPLVSSDFLGDPHSCIIDSLSTMVIDKNMVKILGWYDNEWGYSCRTSDLAAFISEKGL